ncbi:uncharacterized protein [Rhodnius prolixus]|uniref:uncharacterized protein n=1 Tax=Rhodnius prolixus TaxID=13249 RepID=UPI003D18E259
MDKVEGKLFVHIVKEGEDDFKLAGISEDKVLWFRLPSEFQNLKIHKVLCAKSTIKCAIRAIKPINGYRKVGVRIDELLKKRVFKLHEVERKFILGKFEKKLNATEWFAKFEAECSRHKVSQDSKIIEVLRFFLEGSAKDWYEANFRKIGLTNWSEWKKSFMNVFVDKGWSMVRRAYNYKYLGGSLVDYALVKEKLCLECESSATIQSRIKMIVVGLPLEIQDELDREEVIEMDKLYTALRKLDDSYSTKRKDILMTTRKKVNKQAENCDERKQNKSNQVDKKPCYICEA